jgi:cytochrome c-type biogenesis protein CcmH/NrfG
MSARAVSWLLAGATVVYLAFIAQDAWLLIATGEPVAVMLGAGLLLLPVVGVWVVAAELRFGIRTAELSRELEQEGGLPVDDLPRTASGRLDRQAADERFQSARVDTEAAPKDWRAWYRLAVAYDDARDRRQARAAMRTAIRLHNDNHHNTN